jgi:methionyl-tRNA formyltransferase
VTDKNADLKGSAFSFVRSFKHGQIEQVESVKMKLIFAGTPPFSAAALSALVSAGHDIALVLTQPDKPANRGLRLTASAVADTASALNLRVEKPASLKNIEAQTMLRDVNADAMIVAAYGLILPQAVLDIPRLGCINIHGSILPRWRGAAPVQRAIEAGDTETGITIMQMDAGLDTGPMLQISRLPISSDDTSATLFAKLTLLGAQAIADALAQWPLNATAQTEAGTTYAKKILKTEAALDFAQPAVVLERKIRAFDPFPGCEITFSQNNEAQLLKVWRACAEIAPANGFEVGQICNINATTLAIQCGEGQLYLEIVQKAGGKRIAIAQYLQQTSLQLRLSAQF